MPTGIETTRFPLNVFTWSSEPKEYIFSGRKPFSSNGACSPAVGRQHRRTARESTARRVVLYTASVLAHLHDVELHHPGIEHRQDVAAPEVFQVVRRDSVHGAERGSVEPQEGWIVPRFVRGGVLRGAEPPGTTSRPHDEQLRHSTGVLEFAQLAGVVSFESEPGRDL